MDRWLCSLLGILALCGGCSSPQTDRDSEQRAAQHFAAGRALEEAGRLNDAAMEYAIVAEIYSATTFHDDAVRKAALLYSHPDNPARNDSTSLHWLALYKELPLSDPELQSVQLHIKAIEEMSDLRKKLEQQTSVTDSLSETTKLQLQEIIAKSKRMHELEQEIAKLSDELEKLREIDMKVGRNKDK